MQAHENGYLTHETEDTQPSGWCLHFTKKGVKSRKANQLVQSHIILNVTRKSLNQLV